MDPQLFDILWEVYREVGAKEPITIHLVLPLARDQRDAAPYVERASPSSACTCSARRWISTFRACRSKSCGTRACGFQRGGVGFYPSSGSPFVHMDTGGVAPLAAHGPGHARARDVGPPKPTLVASAERRRMPLPTTDEEETETAKPAASRLIARKPETKPGAVATAPNAQQAFALASASSKPVTLGAGPRPPAPVPAAPATNGAVQSWLNDIDQRQGANDRVAPETALAYAAAAAPEQPRRTASLFNPTPPRARARLP